MNCRELDVIFNGDFYHDQKYTNICNPMNHILKVANSKLNSITVDFKKFLYILNFI